MRIAYRLGWVVDSYPANDNVHTEDCPDWHREAPRCEQAYARRNRAMIASGVDECVAFDLGDSQVVDNCVARAGEKDVPVTRIRHQWRNQ